MALSKDEIIASLREAITKVAKTDVSETPADEALGLDSINRISLIVELEWVFDVEIDSSELEPEVFESLDSLADLIVKLVD